MNGIEINNTTVKFSIRDYYYEKELNYKTGDMTKESRSREMFDILHEYNPESTLTITRDDIDGFNCYLTVEMTNIINAQEIIKDLYMYVCLADITAIERAYNIMNPVKKNRSRKKKSA